MRISTKDAYRLREEWWNLRISVNGAKLDLDKVECSRLFAETRSLFISALRSSGGLRILPIADEWLRVLMAVWVLEPNGLAERVVLLTVPVDNLPNDIEAIDLFGSLAAYCLRLISYVELASPLRRHITDPQARARFLQRDIGDVEYLRATRTIVCSYVERLCGMDAGLHLEEHLDPSQNAESLLHATQAWYRDHTWHAIDVLLLGLAILKTEYDGIDWASHLAASVRERNVPLPGLDEQQARRLVFENWCVAALFHDVGYGLAISSAFAPEIGKLQSSEVDQMAERLQRAVADGVYQFNWELRTRAKTVDLDLPLISGLDHGLCSFSRLLYLIEQLPSYDELRPKLNWALRAIALHNLPDHPMDVSIDPIAALLVVCDELQEWHREHVECDEVREHVITDILFPSPHPLDRVPFVKDAWIDIVLTPKGLLQQQNMSLRAELAYVSPDEGQYNPQRIWLQRARNFQRIKWNSYRIKWNSYRIKWNSYDLPDFDIVNMHVHSVDIQIARLKDPTVSEHGILCRFAFESSRRTAFGPWFNAINDGLVSHAVDNTRESLSFNLSNLSRCKPIQRPVTELLEGFPKWRKEQR